MAMDRRGYVDLCRAGVQCVDTLVPRLWNGVTTPVYRDGDILGQGGWRAHLGQCTVAGSDGVATLWPKGRVSARLAGPFPHWTVADLAHTRALRMVAVSGHLGCP